MTFFIVYSFLRGQVFGCHYKTLPEDTTQLQLRMDQSDILGKRRASKKLFGGTALFLKRVGPSAGASEELRHAHMGFLSRSCADLGAGSAPSTVTSGVTTSVTSHCQAPSEIARMKDLYTFKF